MNGALEVDQFELNGGDTRRVKDESKKTHAFHAGNKQIQSRKTAGCNSHFKTMSANGVRAS